MTYATVMVSLALDQPNEARLAVAGQIAERFDAGLTGIVASVFSPPPTSPTGDQAQALIDQGQASIKRRMSELEAQFRDAAKNRARHIEWRCSIDFPARYVLQEARCADIIVSGGHSDAFSDPFALVTPKDLVMEAGRPLFVVPDSADWLDLRSMLVAWKDTPEARRAIVDSLPMLRKAKDVTVAEIVRAGGSQPARRRTGPRCRNVAVASRRFRLGARGGAEPGPRCDRSARRNGRRRWRGSCCRWRLRSFAVSRVGSRRHDPTSDHPDRALRVAVALAAKLKQRSIGPRLVQISSADCRRIHDARCHDRETRTHGARV